METVGGRRKSVAELQKTVNIGFLTSERLKREKGDKSRVSVCFFSYDSGHSGGESEPRRGKQERRERERKAPFSTALFSRVGVGT